MSIVNPPFCKRKIVIGRLDNKGDIIENYAKVEVELLDEGFVSYEEILDEESQFRVGAFYELIDTVNNYKSNYRAVSQLITVKRNASIN
jgi:hypothetical protein